MQLHRTERFFARRIPGNAGADRVTVRPVLSGRESAGGVSAGPLPLLLTGGTAAASVHLRLYFLGRSVMIKHNLF